MNEHLVLRSPDSLPLEEAALMLCAASGDHEQAKAEALTGEMLTGEMLTGQMKEEALSAHRSKGDALRVPSLTVSSAHLRRRTPRGAT